MIEFKNVTKIYPPHTKALDGVNFQVESGKFVTIAGKSGAGKTTLLEVLLGEEKPTKGEVSFDGIKIHELSSRELPEIRQNIGAIFQDYKLIPSKTAYENIVYVMEVIGAPDEEIERRAPQALEIVDIEDKAERYPPQLSEGEQQRVAIARALAIRPKVILADEPTGNLDPYCGRDIIQLLIRINELDTTVILATHDKEVVDSLNKRVISLREGEIVSDQNPGKFIL